jgi:8-oxo-dGTP diphosphatase
MASDDHHKHFVGNVAQKAIIEKDGKVLVCRGVGDEVWEFPGGRLNADEAPADGLVREVQEELGILVKLLRPVYVTRAFHEKSKQWTVFIGYVCAVIDDANAKVDVVELEEIRWLTRDELKSLRMFEDCRELADAFLAG